MGTVAHWNLSWTCLRHGLGWADGLGLANESALVC